jgi:membrane protein YdbS with pleckstrin-like domain
MPPAGYRLNDNEHMLLDLRPHWWFFSRHILTGIPLWGLVAVVWATSSGWLRTALLPALTVLAALWLVWLALRLLAWRFTFFLVSDQRVVYRTGVLARRGVEIPLSRIANINFEQSIWTRLIGAGDLDIESAGREGTTKFSDVRHPDEVQREIYRQMDAAEGRAADRVGRAAAGYADQPGAAPAAVPDDALVADELGKLADLRDRGVLSDAEFADRKARLLGGGPAGDPPAPPSASGPPTA